MGSHEGLLGFHIWGLWEVHGGPFVRHCGKPFVRPFMHYFVAWKFFLWNSVIPQFILTIIRVIPSEMSMTGVDLHLWWSCLSRKSSAGNFWFLCCLRASMCIFGYKFILKSEELQCGVAEVSNPTSADTKWYIHPIPCTPYTQYTIYPVPHIHNR